MLMLSATVLPATEPMARSMAAMYTAEHTMDGDADR